MSRMAVLVAIGVILLGAVLVLALDQPVVGMVLIIGGAVATGSVSPRGKVKRRD